MQAQGTTKVDNGRQLGDGKLAIRESKEWMAWEQEQGSNISVLWEHDEEKSCLQRWGANT